MQNISLALSQSSSVYFPNLNGIRFIAAFSVLIHHIEQVKVEFGVQNIYANPLIKSMGKLGVCLFFVLSGFLITYLLLHEKGRFQKINKRDFYIRRILRIWPLYFLVVILSFFVFPYIPFFIPPNDEQSWLVENVLPRLSLFFVVLPNIGFILYNSPYSVAQTWSIGVEEQFYYIWPWIIDKFTWKRIFITVFIFSIATIGIVYFYYAWVGNTQYANNMPEIIRFFFSQFRIFTLMLGGVCAALVYYQKKAILTVLYRPSVQILVYLLFIVLLGADFHPMGINLEFYSLFFGYFILNVSSNPRSIINLEYKWVSYLGKISYGIYMYQTACIIFTVNLLQWLLSSKDTILFNLLVYIVSTLFTIGISAFSYAYFEKPFLKLKERFSPN